MDVNEASEADAREYENFNDFFTRSLRPGFRPIANSDIVSPADGVVSQFGFIDRESLVQAKGRFFLLSELLKPSRLLH